MYIKPIDIRILNMGRIDIVGSEDSPITSAHKMISRKVPNIIQTDAITGMLFLWIGAVYQYIFEMYIRTVFNPYSTIIPPFIIRCMQVNVRYLDIIPAGNKHHIGNIRTILSPTNR